MGEEFEPYYCPIHTLVLQDEKLSDSAVRLYALYQIKILTAGWIGIDDKKAANWLGWSLQKLRKAKNELIKQYWLIPWEVSIEGKSTNVLFTQPQFVKYGNAFEAEAAAKYPNFDPQKHGWQKLYGDIIKLGM